MREGEPDVELSETEDLASAAHEAAVGLGSADRKRAIASIAAGLFGEEAEALRIGRYRVERELGRGGMGVVYAAYDAELERRVAVKLIRSETGEVGDNARSRLKREAQAMARLNHRNVVHVYDVGEFEDQVYVAMEFVEGETLGAWLETPRPWQDIVRMFLQAGEGLAAAHASNVIHRDFKPDNVLVAPDGRAVVLDFGLARAEGKVPSTPPSGEPRAFDSVSLTQTGAVMGTPAYMSPEQHEGRASGAPSDQFSFCVALYRSVYGQRPFAGDNLLVLGRSVLEGKLRPPPRRRELPARLGTILTRGLSRDAQARWPSMRQLLDELQSLLGLRRRRLALAAAGLGLVGAVAAGGLLSGDDECEVLEQRLASVWNEEKQGALETLSEGATHGPAWQTFDGVLAEHVDVATRLGREVCTEGRGADRSLQVGCLEASTLEAETLLEAISNASEADLAYAFLAVRELDPPRECETPDRARGLVPLPEERGDLRRLHVERGRVVRARELNEARDHRGAQRVLGDAVAAIDDLGYLPVAAEAKLQLGIAQRELGEPSAEANLKGALEAAEEANDDALVGRARHELAALLHFTKGEADKAELLRDQGDAKSASVSTTLRLGEATAKLVTGRLESGLEDVNVAIEGMDAPSGEALAVRGLILALMGRYEAASVDLDAAAPLLAEDNPRRFLLDGALGIRALQMGHDDEAIEHLRAATQRIEKEAPKLLFLPIGRSYLAVALDRSGDTEGADELHAAALAAPVDDLHPVRGRVLYHLGHTQLRRGQLDEADASFSRAKQIWDARLLPDHPAIAQPMTGLALVALARGENARARRLLEDALARVEAKPEWGHAWEDALTRFALARALVRTGGDTERARELAARAAGDVERLGPGLDALRTEIAEWLKANP